MEVEIVEGEGTVLEVNVGHPIATNEILCVRSGDALFPNDFVEDLIVFVCAVRSDAGLYVCYVHRDLTVTGQYIFNVTSTSTGSSLQPHTRFASTNHDLRIATVLCQTLFSHSNQH